MPKNRSMARGAVIIHKTIGTRADLNSGTYVYRGTGSAPETYALPDGEHRFDGSCHDDCEDVR